ncbi:MAG: DUF5719 family protein [Mycobacteriales bacterium]
MTVALGVLAGLGTAAVLTQPPPPPTSVVALEHPRAAGLDLVRAPADGQTLVCPDVRRIPGTLDTVVVVGTADPGPGAVDLLPASGPPKSPQRLLSAGQLTASYRGPLTGPLVVKATGPLAGALVAEQLSRANKTADRGWADDRCEPPRAVQWFVGPGTGVGDDPVVTLANPDDVPALVDINVLTPAGPADDPQGQGVAIAPHSVSRIPLTTLAPGATATAVQVSTVSGRVAAAVRDVRTNGLIPLGTDWVPVADGPHPQVVVAGVPGMINGTPPARTLILANPGTTDTTVTVETVTGNGEYVPTGLSAVVVPAGTVRTVDLGSAVGPTPATAVITTSTPSTAVLAGVLVDAASTYTGIHEIAYLGAAQPLAGPALVPENPIAAEVDSVLELSAPGATAAVTVTIPGGGGRPGRSFQVGVPPGRSIEVSLRHDGVVGGPVTVTPVPGSGPVYAVRVIEERGALGPLIAAFGLVGSPPLVTIPPVRPAPFSGG